MRYFGKVGYGESVETSPGSGVWRDTITEIEYTGDIVRVTHRLQEGENLNKNLTVTNAISVVVDEHATKHFSKIKYAEWAGEKWNVNSVELRPPRLTLHLGGVYNGPTS